jgi:excisionase family DNA binding protein
MEEPRMYLTPPQIAAMFQTSEETVRRWIRLGVFRGAWKTPGGRQWRVPRAEVERVLKAARAGVAVA